MVTDERNYYKPFQYNWAYEAYKTQQHLHWMPEEVPFADDLKDYRLLDEDSKKLIGTLFRFFTQSDVDVAGGYATHYLPTFKPPEIRMMLSAFAAMEAVHMDAYSTLIETLGVPENEYQMFMKVKAMSDKHEYLGNFNMSTKRDIAKTVAVYSGFTEGVQLFSSFAILLNFPRHNLMKNMGQIITWSIRDEDLHVDSMSKVFRSFIRENPEIWDDELKYEIYCACERVVEMEDAFIDEVFQSLVVQDLTKEEVKGYIRFIGDKRLMGLGMKKIFNSTNNPLKWIDYMVNAVEHTNFFENRSTEYAKASTTGNWQDIFK
jgi:ribonucleoside-diphosphate reductase beta chain